jgi:hypothetical protein
MDEINGKYFQPSGMAAVYLTFALPTEWQGWKKFSNRDFNFHQASRPVPSHCSKVQNSNYSDVRSLRFEVCLDGNFLEQNLWLSNFSYTSLTIVHLVNRWLEKSSRPVPGL